MTKSELKDRCYLLATGNHLTEDFNYSEYQNTDISEHLWQLTEDWPIKELESHITGIADQVERLALQYAKEQSDDFHRAHEKFTSEEFSLKIKTSDGRTHGRIQPKNTNQKFDVYLGIAPKDI